MMKHSTPPFKRLFAMMMCVAWCPHAAAQAVSDEQLLSATLPEDFRYQRVEIYPIVDQRLIGASLEGKTPPQSPAVWRYFLEEISTFHNLTIVSPAATRAALRQRLTTNRELRQALEIGRTGIAAYREVRLVEAEPLLKDALNRLINLDYHVVAPEEVAQIALKLGQTHLEGKRKLSAQTYFQRALLIHPILRLNPDYDHPATIIAFEKVRAELTEQKYTTPPRFGTFQRIPALGSVVRARLTNAFVELLVISKRGIQTFRQPLTSVPRADASRLASKLFACLPRGRAPRPLANAQLLLDSGFSGSLYTQSPLAPFANLGLSVTTNLILFERLSIEGNAEVSASGRDAQEHLREDLTTLNLRLGVGLQGVSGRLSGFAHLGLQVERLSAVVITTSVACKYFSRGDEVPTNLCDFDSDFNRTPPAWSVGPALSIGGRIRLIAGLHLIARVSAATFIFSTEDTGFDWPIGASIALGYQLM
ncbi:MAG: hypothetical protein VX589_19860 [Myxococcota bacterium]|nr:hypothetical protein [Myxococcota bacterium]